MPTWIPTETEVREALERTQSPTLAAEHFGVTKRTVYRWMERYGISRSAVWTVSAPKEQEAA